MTARCDCEGECTCDLYSRTGYEWEHECHIDKFLGCEVPCAYCSKASHYIVEIGPITARIFKNDLWSEKRVQAILEKSFIVIKGEDDTRHIIGVWKLKDLLE